MASNRKISRWEIILGLPKSFVFNMKYFPFKQAVKLPVLLSPWVYLKRMEGEIKLGEIKRGIVKIGFTEMDFSEKSKESTVWNVSGIVTFKGRANISSGNKLVVYGNLVIGNHFNVSGANTIMVKKEIIFGDDNLLSWDILIMDYDHHDIVDNAGNVLNPPKRIEIGNKIWVGCRSTILKGTKLGDGCVIGANSLLNKEFEGNNKLIGGNPAKIISDGLLWEH